MNELEAPDDADFISALRALRPEPISPATRQKLGRRLDAESNRPVLFILAAVAAAAAACVGLATLLPRQLDPASAFIRMPETPSPLPTWAAYGAALRQSPAQLEALLDAAGRERRGDGESQIAIFSPRDAAQFLEQGDPL